MSSRGDHGPRTADRFARAAALVRALTGVVDARIDADAGGIRTIAVTAAAGTSAWEITRNVQSALLASLGLAIDRSAVRVCHPEGAAAPAPELSDRPAAADVPRADAADRLAGSFMAAAWPPWRIGESTAPTPGREAPPPATVVANGAPAHANGAPKANGAAANGAGANGANGAVRTAGNGSANGKVAPVAAPPAAAAALAPAVPRFAYGGSIARLELEARRDARLCCRVVVALADRIAAGESEGEDTPAGRLEAAARAVIAAAPAVGAEFDGIRAVDVAGRSYVLVAVRRWSGRELTYRAAVAPQDASPEAAAARATLDALLS